MDKPISVGSVVFSRAGRDSGVYFLVTEVVDDTFVRICDGDVRKLAKPKLKKIKHLKITGDVIESIGDKLQIGTKVYDAEIYSALRRYNS
ncbi:MAG: RNA-binding protein [Clostridia bacterium]|nr:RNA-binding protein [Clostridia bacterium]